MAQNQDITTRELAVRTAINSVANDDTLLVKTVGVAGRLYEQLTIGTGLEIIGNPGSKIIVATGESTPGAHAATHEPGGGDEVGVLALRPLLSGPSPESGRTILYVFSGDEEFLHCKFPDSSDKVLLLASISSGNLVENAVLAGYDRVIQMNGTESARWMSDGSLSMAGTNQLKF